MTHRSRQHQGQLVLVPPTPAAGGHPGDNNRPPLPATATPAAVTAPTGAPGANRDTIAALAAPTAASTSPRLVPVAAGIDTSTPAVTATPTNQCRTASARRPITRNQPRTVHAGTPTAAPIRRCPTPAALASRAAQITSAEYALRSNNDTGNNT